MTWRRKIGGKFPERWLVAKLSKKNIVINAFLWENFCYIFFPFFMSGLSD
jgi:hypothetical protein